MGYAEPDADEEGRELQVASQASLMPTEHVLHSNMLVKAGSNSVQPVHRCYCPGWCARGLTAFR